MNKSVTMNYRRILKEELARRSLRNPAYSLRSFARDLNIAPSTLSEVIKGRHGFSPENANRIVMKLNLNDGERDIFRTLVSAEHGRKYSEREQAKSKLKAQKSGQAQLDPDRFDVISDWHHYAILEALALADVAHTPEWFAARLDIGLPAVESALERLERLDLIEMKNRKYVAKNTFTASPSGTPSAAVRKFHKQILEKAIDALETQPIEERTITNMIMAVDPAQMEEAREEIKEFRRKFEAKFCKPSEAEEVYNFSVQFFRLTKKRKPNHEKD